MLSFLLLIPLLTTSCNGRRVDDTEQESDTPEELNRDIVSYDEEVSDDIKVNIYVENSGSMDGFVKGLTNFKSDIGNLLADVKYHYNEENVKIYFIHNDLHENLKIFDAASGKDLADVAQWINVEWKKEPRGSNTKLNNIFKKILDNTDGRTVSILISDCIYSIGKNGNTMDLLDHEKTTTKDAFLSRSKKGDMVLSTLIFRMISSFDGKYYPYTGDVNNYQYTGNLPYFICVFADNTLMKDFCTKVKISDKDYKGYTNRYSFVHGSAHAPRWTILPMTKKSGRFNASRESKFWVHGIEGVKMERGKHLAFAIAIDMNEINVPDDYMTDISNYELDNDKYQIDSITHYNGNSINSTDLAMIKRGEHTPTHVIYIKSTGTAVCDLTITLKRQVPIWVSKYSIMDDTKPDSIRTGGSFGLQYWVEGISRAYETLYPNETAYYELCVKITK